MFPDHVIQTGHVYICQDCKSSIKPRPTFPACEKKL